MAQKIQTLFIDDMDGSTADGTARFALDSTSYEIDLNAEHAGALRAVLSRYVNAARRGPGSTQRPARPRPRPRPDSPDNAAVRDWARNQGINVKDRGRIPTELVMKFKVATTQ